MTPREQELEQEVGLIHPDDKNRLGWMNKRLGQVGIDARQSKHHIQMRYYLELLQLEIDITERFLRDDGCTQFNSLRQQLLAANQRAEEEMLRLKLVEHILDGDGLPPNTQICPTAQSAIRVMEELVTLRKEQNAKTNQPNH